MKNTFKITALLFLLGGAVISTLPSCNKYPDGPELSLRSRSERVANTWKVDNYKMNGYDYTSLVTDYRETFSKDGNFSFNWGTSSGTGTWTFQNDDTEIRLTGVSNQSSHTMTILKLEEKSFWYYFTENNDRHEYHMIPQ